METPKFIVKYWIKENRNRNSPPVLSHAVFYSEDSLIKGLRNVQGNYFVFTIGNEYKSKSEFDKIFLEEKETKEREEYLKLKQKYEND